MIVVDSSVWIDYFNNVATHQTDRLDRWLGHEPILIGDLILTEVMQGFRRQSEYDTAKSALAELFYEDMVGREIAVQSAENYRFLRAKGVTVRKTIDVLIGTFCIVNNHSLLDCDRDFDVMERYLNLNRA